MDNSPRHPETRLDSGRIHQALRYVHHWEAKERGDQRMSRPEAARYAARDLSALEKATLARSLNLGSSESEAKLHKLQERLEAASRTGELR